MAASVTPGPTVDVESSIGALLTFVGDLRRVLEAFGPEFAPRSQADSDSRELDDSEATHGVLGQAALLYESSSDHAVALTRILRSPTQGIAPFSLARSAIEVSSICCWILEPGLAARTRQARSIAFRRKGVEGQRTLVNENPTVDDGGVSERLSYLKDRQERFGAERVSVPPATDLVATWFGGRSPYRLLSAVVHGHPWAISQVAFARSDLQTPTGMVFLEPTLKPDIVLYLLILTLDALAKPFWLRTLYCGHERATAVAALELTYDAMQMGDGRRFWRAG